MMIRPLFLLFVFCLTLNAAVSDYAAERVEAVKLMQTGKYEEAITEFRRLAESTPNEMQKADALSNVAICLQQLKRTDEAMELALQIRPEAASKLCQMEILRQQRKWNDLLVLCGDDDLTTWPDALIYPALMLRGTAYNADKKISEAERDFAAAAQSTSSVNEKAKAYIALAEIYSSLDPQKALDAYGEVCKLEPDSGGIWQRALAGRARLFAGMKEWDQANAEVSQLETVNNKDPHWICMVFLLRGEINEKQGNLKEALENYQSAGAVEKAPAQLVEEARAKIANLEKKP